MTLEIRDRKNLEKYVQQMLELKARLSYIKENGSKKDRFQIENTALHIRKIIETFAFSLMSLQKDSYRKYRESANADFLNDWNGREILNNLLKLNPDLFFEPIQKEIRAVDGTKVIQPLDKKQVYSIKQLSKLYERCGGILHVSNPWKNCKKIESFGGELPRIIERLSLTFEDQSILVNHWKSNISTAVIVTLTGQGGNPSIYLAVSDGNFALLDRS